MRRLTKGTKPQILVDNEVAWTEEYIRRVGGDATVPKAALTRYRDPEIKAAIIEETSGKCAYCESKVEHVYPGDCEHILPKSSRPDLVVEWDNLTYVCAECNRRKLDYYSMAEPLIHPYLDEPTAHLRHFGPLVIERPGDDKGYRTVTRIGLSRTALLERRKERIESVHGLVDRWMRLQVGPTKDLVRQAILDEAADSREYSTSIKAMLNHVDEWRT